MSALPRIDRSLLGNAAALLLLALLAAWLLHLQAAPWPAITPIPKARFIAAIALAIYLAFCGWIAWRGRTRQAASTASAGAEWRVAYASQTGFALELAERTATALRDAGCGVRLLDIATLDAASLAGTRCLFIVSTTGEGDPPDHALGFAGRTLGQDIDLRGTQYAVLALGDREYARYCAFGHQLDDWLRHRGARPLFDLVEVDNADPGALRHWQHQIGVLAGRTDQPDWSRPQYQPWRLRERRHLNPGSAGGAAFHIALEAPAGVVPAWQAGDIAEIGPRNPQAAVLALLDAVDLPGDAPVMFDDAGTHLADALSRAQLPAAEAVRGLAPQALCTHLQRLPHREYSIASIPADGQLDLLVRLMPRADGSPGIGSGWLCEYASPGQDIDLRIRRNPNFHAPDPARPMLLIGNGTGLAGLRAHLKARIASGAHRNWLLFGERNAAHDHFHGNELDGWLRAGKLARLDRVYSRDGGELRYVQDAVRAHAEALHEWINAGAAIYVCGSLQGMAPGLDAVLVELLGQHGVDRLIEAGRYRRDVY